MIFHQAKGGIRPNTINRRVFIGTVESVNIENNSIYVLGRKTGWCQPSSVFHVDVDILPNIKKGMKVVVCSTRVGSKNPFVVTDIFERVKQ